MIKNKPAKILSFPNKEIFFKYLFFIFYLFHRSLLKQKNWLERIFVLLLKMFFTEMSASKNFGLERESPFAGIRRIR